MDIRHLKAFLAVFEERNITTAAQRLFVSQPTLSVTIKQLEEALGVTLFKRIARGVEVSEEARALYPQARSLVGEAEALKHRFRGGEKRLSLTLGVEQDISPRHVTAFLQLAITTVPDLHLSLQDGCTGDARLAVEDLRCEDELFLPIWDDPFVCAVAIGMDLDTSPSLFPWIICPSHPSHQRLIPLYGNAIPSAAQSSSLHLSLAMVAAGMGVAALPQSMVETLPSVSTHPLSSPLPSRRVGLCFSSKALEHPALRLLHAALRHQAYNS